MRRSTLLRFASWEDPQTDPHDAHRYEHGLSTSNERFGVTKRERERSIKRFDDYLADDRRCTELP